MKKKVKKEKGYEVRSFMFIGADESGYEYKIKFNQSLQSTHTIFAGIPDGLNWWIKKEWSGCS